MAGKMTINDMRRYIIEAYPNSIKFKDKVLHMPTRQVIAIYHSVVRRQNDGEKKPNKKDEFHQMDIWEYMLDKIEEEDGPGTHTQINLQEENIHDQRSKGNE